MTYGHLGQHLVDQMRRHVRHATRHTRRAKASHFGFDVGRTRDRSELAVFEEIEGRFTCRLLRSFEGTPFAEQEAELRRLLGTLPVARLSIDRSGIGMNLAENLARDFPQVVGENVTSDTKERWATDFKILLQRRATARSSGRSTRSSGACCLPAT